MDQFRALAYLTLYSLKSILYSRRELLLVPMVSALVSVVLVPYGLSRYVGEHGIAAVASTGLVIGAIVAPSVIVAFYTVAELSLGSLERLLVLPVPRYTVILSRLLASSIANLAPLTMAIALAAGLHGLQLRVGAMPLVYVASMAAAMGVSGLALLIIGPLKSIHQISIVVSVLGVILTNLSPLLFPLAVLPTWAKVAVALNPLTGAVVISRSALLGSEADPLIALSMITISISWLLVGMLVISRRMEKV